MKLVSIIVPVYNLEDYILSNLESLEAQTYKNIEVIIIDDGSTDNSVKVISEFVKDKTLIYRIFTVENGGVSRARNIGIKKAEGDYLLLIDGDDRLKPNAIEAMLKTAEANKADLCFSGYEECKSFNEAPVYTYKSNKQYIKNPIPGYEALKKKLLKEIWVCTGNALYSRALIKGNDIYYSEGMAHGEDVEFIGKALFNAKTVVSVEEDFLQILLRGTSAMRSKFSPKNLDALKTNRNFFNYVMENKIGISEEKIQEVTLGIDFDYINTFLGAIKKIYSEYNLSSPFKAIKKIKELKVGIEGIDVARVKKVVGRSKSTEITIFNKSKLLYFYCTKLLLAIKER